MRKLLLRWLPLSLLLGLGGCATLPPMLPADGLREPARAVELVEVPFFPQERYQCGPAALTTVLNWSGLDLHPDRIAPRLYIPAREGTLQPELLAQTRQHGRLAYPLSRDVNALLAELSAGHPVLVLQNLGLSWWEVWHYAVVIGYDPQSRLVTLRSGVTERRRIPLETFLRTWARGGNWAMLALPPGTLPATAEPGAYLRAAFELEQTGRQADAIAAYAAGVEHWPLDFRMPLALANALYAGGDSAAAAQALEAAVDRGIEHAGVYNNWATLLSQAGRHREALHAAQRAVALGGADREPYRTTLREVRTAGGFISL